MALKGNNNTGDAVVVMDWAVLTYIWVFRRRAITVATNCPREQSKIKVKPTQDYDHHNHSAYHICYHKATQLRKNYLTTSLRDQCHAN